MEIDDINFYEIFDTDISVICKRKRFEEGLFRAFVTFIAEILIFLKTRKLWRDANCPLRLYKINDFILIKNKIPSGILTPNIVSTMFFLLLNLTVSIITIKLKSEKKNSGVTWKDKNPLKKYMKILSFSFKSFGQVIKIKL